MSSLLGIKTVKDYHLRLWVVTPADMRLVNGPVT